VRRVRGAAFAFVLGFCCATLADAAAAADPLASWNDGAVKRSIVAFVAATTKAGSPDFVPPAERIAVFDNDGTLWIEQPMYIQLAFALDRVRTLAAQNPMWKTTEPFASILSQDIPSALAGGHKSVIDILMATHAGMTTDAFAAIVAEWLATARDPRFKRPYTECVYQPMLELLAYLRANGFKTFIVSGGGIEFMRVFTEPVYGIPPEQVVGSTIDLRFEMKDGAPVLMREAKVDFIDDGPGKPIGIQRFLGVRPIFAFGNSDGDQQMLEWTAGGSGKRFLGLVHHTDAEREWAYDHPSKVGQLDTALTLAKAKGWSVVDMKNDWKRIFPFDETAAAE
jgi:phosphoglycolate phosphatase-like HAD superfamily hydrolase